jgi:hypothetical protein
LGPSAAALAAAARRKSEGPSKDYNRHWLIQVTSHDPGDFSIP